MSDVNLFTGDAAVFHCLYCIASNLCEQFNFAVYIFLADFTNTSFRMDGQVKE